MDEGQNYTAFSSRGLLDMIGDLNDKALEASRMKDFIGVLGGRFLNWAQRKSLFRSVPARQRYGRTTDCNEKSL